MKVVVTGANGLIGWHCATRLHAANCVATFRGDVPPYSIVLLDRNAFEDDQCLLSAVRGSNAILHFAGVNRGADHDVEEANPKIAERLSRACADTGETPHILYANSTHSGSDTPYGRSKRIAGQILSGISDKYTNLVLPHIFGECARPRYNNVTATFVESVIQKIPQEVNPNGKVMLLHAGVAAQHAIDAVLSGHIGTIHPAARETPVPDLLTLLERFHADYAANIFPDLQDPFTLALFNTYRAALYPNGFPLPLKLHTDTRGTLFEAIKGGGGGQTFLSTTLPGVTRGDHFHLNKVERFLVVQGAAKIRIRKVLSDEVWEYRVSGDEPTPVDMPTMHTHSIENIGDTDLLTLFWTHELFDPTAPDTYFDPVKKA